MGVMRRGSVRYLLLEGLVVLFGVLIALFVEGVREDFVERGQAEAAVERVRVEVAGNLAELQDLERVVRDRLQRLRTLHADAPPGVPLADLVGRFTGYRTPDLNDAAWQRLSGSGLADRVDPALLAEAFRLYEWLAQYEHLDREINDLVYSELFYTPEDRTVAIRISERLMEQQLVWAAELVPMHEAFLERVPGGG